MRYVAPMIVGTLVALAPLMTANAASSDEVATLSGDGISGATSSLLGLGIGLDLGLGLDACGHIDVSASAGCEVITGVDATLSCDHLHFGLAGYAECAAHCDASASVACRADRRGDCLAGCGFGLGFDAAAWCEADCAADVEVDCAAMVASGQCDNYLDCEIAAVASCEAECSVVADLWLFASCGVQCGTACRASCEADANLDCQVGCATDLYTDISLACEADINADGALFCDGQYVNGVINLDACVQALLSLDIDVHL